jgi:multiple sugar transport system substrate-binding protein
MQKKSISILTSVLIGIVLILSACAPAATQSPTSSAPQATNTSAAPASGESTATTGAGQPTMAATMAATSAATETSAPSTGATATTSASGGTAGSDTTFDNVDPKGQQITFWHQMTGGNAKALQAIVDDFNKTNAEGIQVTAVAQGNYNDIFNKMSQILNTSDVPALVVAYQNQAATYQLANALTDMTPLVNSAKWGLSAADQQDFFPGFWQQDIFPNYNNARLGFPVYRSEEVLYYNTDWLKELGYDQAPTTPDQFKEAVCKAAKTPFTKSTATGSSIGYEYYTGDASHLAAWTYAFGGNIYDSKTGQFTYNSDAVVNAAAFLQDLVKSGCVSLVAKQYDDQTDFGAGKTLFTTGSTSGINFYGDAVSKGANFNWSIGALPHTTPDPVMNIYGASISIPKSTPEKELAAWLFLKFFGQADNQAKFAEATGYYPVRSSAQSSMTDFFNSQPAYKAGFDLLKYGIAEPPVPGYDAVRDALNKVVSQTLAAPYPDPKPLLDKVNQDANSILQDQLSQMKK